MSSCPIAVKKVRVRSLSVDFNEISWEVESTTLDVLDYTFQVLRSESPEGPWDAISDQFEDEYLFLDNAVSVQNRYRSWYYRIRLRRKSTKEYWDSASVTLGQEPDIVAGELRTHINLLMREFIGERVWVLPVRSFGARCTNCYSKTLRNKTQSGCRTCWDTSYVRGYMHPIETWLALDPSAAASSLSTLGKINATDTTCRMCFYPPLKPGDMIVESADVSRWRVTQVSSTKHVGAVVHQEVQIHQIPRTDIEYKVPVEPCDDLRNLFLKPERQFTNPQQLESLDDEAYEGIFNLYSAHNCGDPKCR